MNIVEPVESQRRYLFAIAYRMLGSASDAEDVVQEAFVRWQALAAREIESPRAYLSTVVTRLCLDRLKSAAATRVDYVGPWLPEPIRTDRDAEPDRVEAAESISLAFLVLLESLSPLERAAYLLHDVFDYTHDEVARIVGRDTPACRKLLERARTHLRARRPRFAPSPAQHRALVERFAGALVSGDAGALEQLLAADVCAFSDGGDKAQAARKPVFGPKAVARLYLSVARRAPAETSLEIAEVNGWPALVVRVRGVPFSVIQLETDGERIYAVRSTLNPDKLSRI